MTQPTLTGLPLGAYRLRGLKQMETSRGFAWRAKLTHDGRAIGSVENRGDGGMTHVMIPAITDREALDAFLGAQSTAFDHHAAQRARQAAERFGMPAPTVPRPITSREERHEQFAEWLSDEECLRQAVSRRVAKQTVFRLADDGPDSFQVLPRPYTAAIGDALRARFGERLIWIANELGQGLASPARAPCAPR